LALAVTATAYKLAPAPVKAALVNHVVLVNHEFFLGRVLQPISAYWSA